MKTRRPVVLIPLLTPVAACADPRPQQYDYGFQYYDEGPDRIRIESHYVRGRIDLDDETSFRFQWLSDAISGASPTGALPGSLQPFLAELDDLRTGLLGAISRRFGDHLVELEVSRSSEEDYLSRGIALKDVWELNQKNTTLTFGINYLDDLVSVPLRGELGKHSYDFFAGVTQILDKNTLVSASLTLGQSQGYLNDPYKSVSYTNVFEIPDGEGGTTEIRVDNLYPENRPDERFRQVLQLGGRRYFERLHGALDATWRYSHDDFGISSNTLGLEWRQELGEHLEVAPFVRYYRQSAADFFVNSADGLGAPPPDTPTGTGPFYSSDYRLSHFDALSGGVKLRWVITENFSATAAYERYEMSGLGGAFERSPDQAYIDADMWTVGFSARF
jgi:hypothetical protein